MEDTLERIPVLALWSAPRSRSTAFARMMAERNDRLVVHEPFSQVVDFGEAKVGDRVVRTPQGVLDALRAVAAERPVFFKDTMDFHYPELLADQAFLTAATHTFIVRHPTEAIASHFALNPNLGRDEIGFAWLYEVFEAVRSATGTTPTVIDSDDLLDRPEDTVRAYCAAVGIPFVPAALSWQPGMRPEWQATGRWHRSTSLTAGFGRREAGDGAAVVDANPVLRGYRDYHLPYYERLREVALRP
ncbi:sulfotransferase family protein [Micromonospora wenchangensis]|uniref:Sulfotransferase family protein n=1 Tax=Micromonospora wenchangensis TaxID=1185415 RepID=A0A246RSA6_9ACTN|nr:sulfotransferase family protein [Micromonospora wenchangensis]OWV12002.1 sulfotransferase family protein [Micromonospora wenchangensis]